jgi:hypothetical protein|tara:strand:- start:254 stop:514 length:261 start_codon:yes stop_codon:yes gene_type:complete
MVNKMLWNEDEVFDYIKYDNKSLIVAWNVDNEEIEISSVEFPDGKVLDSNEMWDNYYELVEDIMSYIDLEFLESEDFWLTKFGYDF